MLVVQLQVDPRHPLREEEARHEERHDVVNGDFGWLPDIVHEVPANPRDVPAFAVGFDMLPVAVELLEQGFSFPLWQRARGRRLSGALNFL